jgi:outer membrane lipoprotein-sorting protein
VKKFKIPKGLATDINKTASVDESKPVSKTGTVSIQIFNYEVNKGISDEVFKGK